MVRAFIDDAETVRYGSMFQRIICITGPFTAITTVIISIFQSVGQKGKPLVLSMLRKGGLDVPFRKFPQNPKFLICRILVLQESASLRIYFCKLVLSFVIDHVPSFAPMFLPYAIFLSTYDKKCLTYEKSCAILPLERRR